LSSRCRYSSDTKETLNINYKWNTQVLLGDNTDFPEDIFVIHLDYPRFIINLKDDEVEFIEEAEDLDETELNVEMEDLSS
jgi:hypothetical protein